MKNKGFTLAELLGVIVILSLITMITVPAITDSLQNYKEKLCNTQLKEIESAAKVWASDGTNLLKLPSEDGSSITVTLKTLSTYGYIDGDIENPVNGEKFDLEDTTVTITKKGKKYVYAIDDDSKKACSE